MASEIAHVVYGARLLTFLGTAVQDPAYWRGVMLPNIRQLSVDSRHPTHIVQVSLHSLRGDTDFATGMRVHAWIDDTREQYLHDQQYREVLAWHPFVVFGLQLLEDELLYEHFDDWNLIHRLLNTVTNDERLIVEDQFAVARWHTLLQHYFAHKPDNASRLALLKGLSVTRSSGEEINTVVDQLRESGVAEGILRSWWQHLEDILR